MASDKRFSWEIPVLVLGIVLFLVGSYIGLFTAPKERYMGDVQRIMYIHLPCAWVAMVCYFAAFIAAIGSLFTSGRKWDAAMTGMIEAGVVLNCLLLVQGSTWARATWGVWWDWDVRLTTSLLMAFLFAGVLALRSFIDDPERRATWTGVATIIAFVDVPIVYFCVRWFRSLHQVQSSPDTVAEKMILPLRMNSFAVLFLSIAFIAFRARLELLRRQHEEIAEPTRREELAHV